MVLTATSSFSSFRLWFTHPEGLFIADYYSEEIAGWTHLVLNYLGLNNIEVFQMFIDGEVEGVAESEGLRFGARYSAGYGRIVVGRRYTDDDWDYASVQVDELLFFNQPLSTVEIQAIYNAGIAWTPPPGWNGTYPVLYWSFDKIGDLVRVEGTSQVNFNPIVPGKVGGYY